MTDPLPIEVVSNLKENWGECGCGCGLSGTYRSRPWKNGQLCVRRVCACKHCLGKRGHDKGDSKARTTRKKLGIAGANTRHEELWGGALRVEIKAGGQISPAYNAFRKCEAQSEAARPIGDWRPFAAVFLPDGSSDGVVAFRLSKAYDVAAALLENLGGIA